MNKVISHLLGARRLPERSGSLQRILDFQDRAHQ